MVFGVGYKQLLANKEPFADIHYENLAQSIEQFGSKMLELKNIAALTGATSVITGPKIKGSARMEKRNSR